MENRNEFGSTILKFYLNVEQEGKSSLLLMQVNGEALV